LIAGKGLPEPLQNTIKQTNGQIRYMGFISDLDAFLKACDIMLNPVLLGGGIKTKAVEALGYDKVVISTHTGAAGILPEVCGDNLHITEDGNWQAFTDAIISHIGQQPHISASFYDTYYWGNIAKKILAVMQKG
jgi:glycosyltransferase involved in cell wall biosynthesis